jgi:hypothetical protein
MQILTQNGSKKNLNMRVKTVKLFGREHRDKSS